MAYVLWFAWILYQANLKEVSLTQTQGTMTVHALLCRRANMNKMVMK